jgi:hypothetical protein
MEGEAIGNAHAFFLIYSDLTGCKPPLSRSEEIEEWWIRE